MGRDPTSDRSDPAETADGAPDEAVPGPPARPRIDVSPALHEAGHEVRDLGFEGIPDSGPVVHPDEPSGPEDPLDFVNVQMPSD